MSCILAADSEPPFVLSVGNAKAYFDPPTVATETRQQSLGLLLLSPVLESQFAELLRRTADPREVNA